MNPRICVSISPSDSAETVSGVQHAEQQGADFSEIRLEKLSSLDGLSDVVQVAKKPLIAANRAASNNESQFDPHTAVMTAVEAGFQYVDLDFETRDLQRTIDRIRSKGAKIILSHHDYVRTPPTHELATKLEEFHTFKPDICKVVTTAHHVNDNLTILEFLRSNRANSSIVSFAMGTMGVWSRLLSPLYGAHFTYASLSRGQETAPGQTPISEMLQIYQTLGTGS
ncbi:MAG TPA: type I 3-dehydroquinate dehydratase [Candidatus Bathyarchaeia archaeon]|nr:type I 3-dehydroquinate dehydratase [Candidatus Bathyarchaeia archaeon]